MQFFTLQRIVGVCLSASVSLLVVAVVAVAEDTIEPSFVDQPFDTELASLPVSGTS